MANTRAQKTAQNLSTLTTAGDIAYASAAGTPARLGIGSSAQVLTVASGVPSWATPAGGGGKVLQVVYAETATDTSITGTTFADTSLTATITPTLNTSKILIFTNSPASMSKTNPATFVTVGIRLLRGATVLQASNVDGGGYLLAGTSSPYGVEMKTTMVLNYYDAPATTSATTYKIQMAGGDANMTTRTGYDGSTSSIILMEIGV